MRSFLLYGLVGGIGGAVAAIIGSLAMPHIPVGELMTRDGMVNVRHVITWDQPHEYLSYFFLGSFVCSLIAMMATAHRGVSVQFRSFLVGAILGGLVSVAGNTAVNLIMLKMAKQVSPDLMLTFRQYDSLHDVGFLLYYAIVPTSLALGLTLSVGINRYTLGRGAIAALLGAAISGVLIHVMLILITPVLLVQVMNTKDVQSIDLSSFEKALMISHLFGMGLGVAIAFAIAQTIFKPAWLKGLNSYLEGRSLPIPGPVAAIGADEGLPLRLPPDGSVAPVHAQVDTSGDRHVIRPVMGPIFVNGTAVQSHWLTDNDLVQIGNYKFRYRTRLPAKAGTQPLASIELPKTPAPTSSQPVWCLADSLGHEHVITEAKQVIGRDTGVDIALPWEPTVSRRHAEITSSPSGPQIEDLRSANGTYVNGVKLVAPAILKPDDQVQLGKCILQVKLKHEG